MTTNRRSLALAVSACLLLVALAGCGVTGTTTGTGTGTPNFATTVVVGDSLSAGYQNGSLLDTQQPHGWASLIATQANTTLTLPLIAAPGAPAVLQLTSVGPPPVITQSTGTTTGRDNPTMQNTDLAVPGHQLSDLINTTPTLVPTTGEEFLTDFVLAFPLGNDSSQMNLAIQLNPTVLFVWIGSNDALQADEAGTPTVMTPVATFTTEFQQLLSTLHSQTKATLIVANIPDVTLVPYLTPATTIIAEVAAATGLTQAQVATALGIQAGDLVNTTGLAQVQAAIAAILQSQVPTPLTDAGFLDATEISTIQSTVTQYNAAIAQEVSAEGGVLVDIHTFIQNLAQNGITINNYNATAGFLGGLFGLDGIHPTNTGYALLANQFIDTINTSLKTTIADVDVSAIAANDPLFGPNIKPTFAKPHIPLNAARRADQLIAPRKGAAKSKPAVPWNFP
jgi:lysophospholipase L1-like esterase